MNKEEFLIEARKLLRARFPFNKAAAEEMGMSDAHLCNVLKGNVKSVPKKLLDTIGYELVTEEQYKKVKKS